MITVNLESFANNKYFLLRYLYDQEISTGEKVVKVNKLILSDVLHLRKTNTIKLVDECCEEELISKVTTKGHYKIEEKGYKVLDIFINTEL